jgi:hypothetical protein
MGEVVIRIFKTLSQDILRQVYSQVLKKYFFNEIRINGKAL